MCVVLLFIFLSCKEAPKKDYVTISGTITSKNSDTLYILGRGFTKRMLVDDNGFFSDTLKVTNGEHTLYDGKELSAMHLNNGYNLKITLDTEAFDETITYEGVGAETNNYLVERTLLHEKLLSDTSIIKLEKEAFNIKTTEIFKQFHDLLKSKKGLDTNFVTSQKKQLAELEKKMQKQREKQQYFVTAFAKGKVSPKFTDYENYLGGTTSLDDFNGKYVYIDIWATWCGPCKKEIPYLKKVEEQYRNKNIEFVSISTDRAKDYDTWKNMVKEEELSGVQLYAKEDTTFTNAYKVNGIPRFILIDPQGNIVDANAPRPSDKTLVELLNELSL
ncbi:hypothetical protein C1H87_18980 [Flavivirga eckloniae]|uniref:Thioredoxin domain-containing protein n=2 Tax=Flavivirga eckloniae TaxID=1803846 RepID=A0A2K9PYQ7_9FLAO|nr:hypothetical protein C1H87_18980 [Flavivirga eckloniae]